MGPVYAEIHIDAPRERIFDYLSDIATRRDLYEGSISNFRLLRLNSIGVGAGARFQFKRRSAWADTSITAAVAPHQISERGEAGRYNLTETGTEWEISEHGADMSTLRLTYWTMPHGIGKYFDRLTGGSRWHTRRLRRAVRRLRDRIEAKNTSVERVSVAGGNPYKTGVL